MGTAKTVPDSRTRKVDDGDQEDRRHAEGLAMREQVGTADVSAAMPAATLTATVKT